MERERERERSASCAWTELHIKCSQSQEWKYTLIRETHRFRLGETSQGLDRLGDEGEGSRGGGILRRQKDMELNKSAIPLDHIINVLYY